MWTDYSTREVADLVGLSEAVVRSCVRAGFVGSRQRGRAPRFSFRDVLVLRVVKSLTAGGVSLRRIRRQLTDLRRRLPDDASLASVSISAGDGHVVIHDRARAWRADTGQLLLGFDSEAAGPEQPEQATVTPLPIRREAPAPEPVASPSADEWFERALLLEEDAPAAAIAGYRRALRLQPDCVETLINLGRLLAETGDADAAADSFRRALELEPADATALYNLGVVAQDAGRDDEAIDLYRRALASDPELAEAHYNLATLFDRSGDTRSAIRHINAYRKLRGRG